MNGLSAAASAMTADERMQRVIMNNITNLATPGFKQSSGMLSSFPSVLLERYVSGSNGQGAVPLGIVQNGTVFQQSVGDFRQGLIQPTGQPLDLAISDPAVTGTSVYAQGPAGPSLISTPSFVVGKKGVIETAAGDPVLPVNPQGNPIPGARAVVNPNFKGLDLFGLGGIPVVDSSGNPSYLLVSANGRPLPAGTGSLRMASSASGGAHSFFAVENVAANGQESVALTRDGQFHAGPDHLLYNAQNQRVLAIGPGGAPILNSAVRLNPAYRGASYFGPEGQPLYDKAGQPSYQVVDVNGRPIAGAAFGATSVDVGTLQALGVTDYLPTAATAYTRSPATLHSGALEGSNASDAQNMVNMIAVYRSYEANQKVVQTLNQTYQQGSSIGQVQGL